MLKLLKAIAVVAVLFSCSFCSPKNYSLDALPHTFIEFGSFGGFTGAEVSGYLLPQGQGYITNSLLLDTSQFEYDKKALKSAVKTLKRINFKDLTSEHGGNMNFYIRLKKKSLDHRVQWTSQNHVPLELIELYQELNELLPRENEK